MADDPVEENSNENSVPEAMPGVPTTEGVPLPPGLKVLTPEEVKAAEESVPETITEEEQARIVSEAIARARAQDEEITQALASIGCYVLVRFESPVSMRHVVKHSETEVQTRTIIAVFEHIVRELKSLEQRDLWARASAEEERAREQKVEAVVTQEILRRGLPNNRATRRKLAQELGLND
jgi:hypothetical protein